MRGGSRSPRSRARARRAEAAASGVPVSLRCSVSSAAGEPFARSCVLTALRRAFPVPAPPRAMRLKDIAALPSCRNDPASLYPLLARGPTFQTSHPGKQLTDQPNEDYRYPLRGCSYHRPDYNDRDVVVGRAPLRTHRLVLDAGRDRVGGLAGAGGEQLGQGLLAEGPAAGVGDAVRVEHDQVADRKSTRLNSS